MSGARERAPAAPLLADEIDPLEIPDAEVTDPARPLAGSFATTALIQGLQAVTAIVLARALGAEGRGELAAVILWPTLIMTLGNLGLAPSVTYYAARTPQLGALVGSTLAIVAADALLLVGIGAVLIPLVLSGHDAGVVATGLIYLVAFVPLSLLALGCMSILNGLQHFRWFQALRILLIVSTLTAVLALQASGSLTIRAAALAYAGAYLLTAAVSAAAALRIVEGPIRVTKAMTRRVLSFGVKSQLSTTMWALNERADQLVISIFLSSTSLGLYVVAVTLTSLTTLIGFSFALVALPVLARIASRTERLEATRAIVTATLLCGAAVSVPILIAEPLIVEILFGSGFDGSVGVGRVLLVAAMVFGLNRVLEAVLQAADRPLDSSIGEAIGLGVTIAGLALLLPLLGIMGAGITSLLAYLTSAAFLTRRTARALDVSVAQLLMPSRGSLKRAIGLAAPRRGASGR